MAYTTMFFAADEADDARLELTVASFTTPRITVAMFHAEELGAHQKI